MEWMSEICNRLGCGSIVQRGTWLWDHVIKFAWWQHPAIWHVPLGWHAIQFAQTSAILKFYFRFRPYHRSRYVILHQSAKFYPNRTAHDRKMTSYHHHHHHRTFMMRLLQQEVKVIWQKAPHGGPIPRLGVTPGGRKLYRWIPGVGFRISVP